PGPSHDCRVRLGKDNSSGPAPSAARAGDFMAKTRTAAATLPALYALVHPGLEAVAADEVTRDLGGEVKKTARGLVVFRLPHIDDSVLQLRTVEDVFLF